MSQVLGHVAWVRPPRQSRSQETLDRILDAAEAVLAEKGFEQASVAEIAGRARSSVGGFYSRFRDKDALLRCLHERFCDEALVTADAALDPARWQGASIAEIFAEVIPFLVSIHEERRGLIRAFIVRSSADPSFLEGAARLGKYVSKRLSELLFARRCEIRHPQPLVAIDFSLQLVLHYLDRTTIFGNLQPAAFPLAGAQLARELVRTCLGYLGVEAAAITDA